MPGQTVFNSARGSSGSAVPGRDPGGRLTLTTGVPVTTADVTGATTIYYTPYIHDSIELWTGSAWSPTIFTEKSEALGTLASAVKPQDVYGFLSGGALDLEFLIWTDATTRATAITLTDGRYTKSGDKTRLYLGTFYPTATTTTELSAKKCFLRNMYNRVPRPLQYPVATASWTQASTTIRQANADTANQVEFVEGIAEDGFRMLCRQTASPAAASTNSANMYIGLDSTTAAMAASVLARAVFVAAVPSDGAGDGHVDFVPTVGYHKLCLLESTSSAANSITRYGTAIGDTTYVCGLYGEIRA